MGMLAASFRVPYRGMPIIACYQFQAAKLRFFPETTKYFFFFLRNILELKGYGHKNPHRPMRGDGEIKLFLCDA